MSVAELIVNLPSRSLRRAALRALAKFHVHSGALPDFIIIGAQKSGTTALHNYLSEHPQVLPVARKEVHFFDINYDKGADWYRRQFIDPRSLNGRASVRKMVSGEATPYYLFHPLAAERIAQTVPDAKLIALLRDPVSRAYSHYQHNLRRENETLSFPDAIQRELEMVAGEQERLEEGSIAKSRAHQGYSYLSRGQYAEQLERYFALFPSGQILIRSSEEFFSDAGRTVGQILDFLGIEPFQLDSWEVPNAGNYDRDAIPEAEFLRRYFEPHNARLYELIGRDLGW